MAQNGFEDYLYSAFDNLNGTAGSYVIAIHIIDEMFYYDDVFALNGKSVTCIDDTHLLKKIVTFVHDQQRLFKKDEDSISRNIKDNQRSYPGKGFCSAAINQLLKYHYYDLMEKEADALIKRVSKGTAISKQLISFFNLNKTGEDMDVMTKTLSSCDDKPMSIDWRMHQTILPHFIKAV